MKRMRSVWWSALVGIVALAPGCVAPHAPRTVRPNLSPVTSNDSIATTSSSKPDNELLQASATSAEPAGDPADSVLSRESAIESALQRNPQLALFREQRGLASAGIVLARIYPYNPIWQSHILGVNGPAAAGITNHLFTENYAVLPLELNGQGEQRRATAAAAATRTEWEIATQEVLTAIGVLRAYDTVLYREKKLRILDETVLLSEQIVKQGKRLAEAGRMSPADVLVAGTELDAARAQIGQGQSALAIARADLQRQIGTLDDGFAVCGELDPPLPILDEKALITHALRLRPEVRARMAAIAEAEARLRLQVADRYGTLAVGPRVDYNEVRSNFIGVVLTGAIPILNTRQGEIALRRADVSRAQVDLRSTEYLVAQSVEAALSRLAAARKWAGQYADEVLPNLKKAQQDVERLFAQNEPGVDVLRVIGVQRTLLRATDAYLDARFEVGQAILDLAAAVGEPALAAKACQPAPQAKPMSGSPPAKPSVVQVSTWIKNSKP